MMGILHTIFILAYLCLFMVVCFCYAKIAYIIRTKLYKIREKNNEEAQYADQNDFNLKHSSRPSGNTSNTKKTVLGRINYTRKNKVVPLTDVINAKTNYLIPVENQERLFDQESGTNNDVRNDSANSCSFGSSYVGQRGSFANQERNLRPQSKHRKSISDARVDRTTKIMFAVTMVFLLSWIPTWSVYFYIEMSSQMSITGEVFKLFASKAFAINTFMNPIFYISLSSVFKERTKQTLNTVKFPFSHCCSRN